jgi:predicted nucleotidyltransferase
MKPEMRIALEELRKRFEGLYGAKLKRLSLFGSQARGDAVPGSDIDVLVVLDGDVSPAKEIARTGQITSELSLKRDIVVSCVFMSSERFEMEQSPLLLNIRKESVPV